jgi:hypothetical protein
MARLIKNRKGLMAYLPKDLLVKTGWTKETRVLLYVNPLNQDQIIIEKLQRKEPSLATAPKLIKSVSVKRRKETGISHGIKYYFSDGTKKFKEKRFEAFY